MSSHAALAVTLPVACLHTFLLYGWFRSELIRAGLRSGGLDKTLVIWGCTWPMCAFYFWKVGQVSSSFLMIYSTAVVWYLLWKLRGGDRWRKLKDGIAGKVTVVGAKLRVAPVISPAG